MEWWIMLIIWGVIFVGTLIVEFLTADIDTIWFCLSSLVCTVIAAFKVHYLIQLGVFIVLSIILMLLTRPLTKRMMEREIVKTNSDKLIGSIGVIYSEINENEIGEVKIDGQIWRAINRDGLSFDVNEKVIIEGISGNKLIVVKLNSAVENL